MPIEFRYVLSNGFNVIIEAAEISSNGGGSHSRVDVALPGDNLEEKRSGGLGSVITFDPDMVIVLPNSNLVLYLY